MKTLGTCEDSRLIVICGEEIKKYFPCGKFDISSTDGRRALRSLLDKTGLDASGRIMLEVFGSYDTEIHIFLQKKKDLGDDPKGK